MRMARAAAMAAVFCGMLFAGGGAPGQDKSQDKGKSAPAEMQVPKPGPEMAKLNYLIGNWTMNAEYVKSPMVPEGGKETGTYRAVAGPGGFSVIADFDVDGPFGKEIGHEVLTWSPKKNAYTVMTVGNSFPDAVMGTGHWEGDNLVIESSFDMGTKVAHMKAVYVNPTDTKVHIDEYSQAEDGSWILIWKGDATK
jgi:hypothetical protein